MVSFVTIFYVFVCVFNRVCTNTRLSILAMNLCVYICIGMEGMYTCKTGNFVNEPMF